MSYYLGNFESPTYNNSKRIYALEKLHNLGFLDHLLELKKAKTIILFGSFIRSDWNENSDLDIFIYGNDDDFEQGKYESKIKREIQLFSVKNKNKLKKFKPELLKNIVNGYIVKGNLDFVEVKCQN
ncbi:MAG: nucleotidyltransferase domain-containing protein [Nanoarchaeota archaeon]|nr:nucleotidyltransferase domain-containing protein [Nanoarchaeota archaeon]MBU4352737.1 nucleotidyltransferase domain-containing protein [Nanoarchaeota archaeon]MBU4456353.1 nucleotidyltransferase domain-containing protein [Nanoarchaeota archaeon]